MASELAKKLCMALIFSAASSFACADEFLVGVIGFPKHSARGWLLADGRCVADARYAELANVLHEGSDWPYGRCDETRFRLPDLRGRIISKPPRPHMIYVGRK